MLDTVREIHTPEGVTLRLPAAGPVPRALAWGIDFAIRMGLLMALGMVLGLLVCYAFGTAWFMTVYARTKGAVSLSAALGWCVLPFLLPDGLKIALALLLSKKLAPHMGI